MSTAERPSGLNTIPDAMNVAELGIPYPAILESIAERYTFISDQERGHLMDLAETLRRASQ